MPKIKITVVKKLNTKNMFGINQPVESTLPHECEKLQEGQVFISENGECPKGFCAWAFADIHRDISHLRLGGNFYWMKEKGVMLSSCTDGLRPVIFKLERIDE
jgi:uncharacterized repeat protein (TIGR04076 family)